MRWLPASLIAVAVLLAPVVWHVSRTLIPQKPVTGASAVDSGARIDIELMRGELAQSRAENEQLRGAVARLESQLAAMDDRITGLQYSQPSGAGLSFDDEPVDLGPNMIVDAYSQVVLIANRRKYNDGLTVPSRSYLIDTIGRPRPDLTDDCQGITNQRLRDLLFVGDVGPIKVRMLKPAVESLTRVFEKVRAVDQDLYDRINTSGSLCVRRIRGTQNTLSSHAFGLALDLNIDGQLDGFADGKTQLGLIILADFFKEEGWIWGAGFGREDSMHFEVSRELLEQWRAAGLI
ncbi:MAG: M15 family metallopeptidase [Pseudomonadota bacterium]